MPCSVCGEEKILAKDLCSTCYHRQWRAEHEYELREYKSAYYRKHREIWYDERGVHYQNSYRKGNRIRNGET